MRPTVARALALVVVAGLLTACGGGGDDDDQAAPSTTRARQSTSTTATTATPTSTTAAAPASTAPTAPPTAPPATAPPSTGAPPPPPTTAAPEAVRGSARLTEIGRFQDPLGLVVRPGDNTLYVIEQEGRVVTAGGAVVLDIRGDVGAGGERGLLGAAFHPGADLFYVNYTDHNGDTHIVEFAFDPAARRALAGSRRELFFVTQPYANHNGGHLAFGPDGHLYAALGDGGSGGDPQNNAQSLDTLLGKLLRISPTPSGGQPYTIPDGNPFVGHAGARPEIWAYGLRNPWRFSFDRATGDMWIGDVGQRAREEIDFQPAGGGGVNYGWNYFEGSVRYREGSPPSDLVGPAYDYARADSNCAVTGGFVYRGSAIARLAGHYVFGDYCRGELLALVDRGGYFESVPVGGNAGPLSSFGQDHNGELYAVSLAGPVYRLDPA
jgi:glucose/arabinose dehydrogenase